MENGRRGGVEKAYGDSKEENTPLGVWILQDKCGGLLLEEPCSHKIRPKLRAHKSLTNCAKFHLFYKFQHENTWSKAPYL